MECRLVVAEKPSVGVALAKVLGASNRKDGYIEGNGYIVSWCVGHLVGLAEPHEYDMKYYVPPWETSLENLPFIPDSDKAKQEPRGSAASPSSRQGLTSNKWKFSVNKQTKKQFELLKKLMNDNRVTEIINSADAGREGECIFRYVYHKANCTKPVKRLWVSSLEESALKSGFDNLRPSSDFDNLYASGFCRARADFLIGINGTRWLSAVHKTFLSVGRVQTPTLAMICERDDNIRNFVKEKYYMVELDCNKITATSERIDSIVDATKIKNSCEGKAAKVTTVKRTKKTENPPKIYDLTTLQREANRIFSYSAKQTLDFTQSLYENKLVTYPRTDSQYITDDMAESTALLVKNIYWCLNIDTPDFDVHKIVKNSGVSDHTGLLPTAESVRAESYLDNLSDGERNILNLITLKLLCAVAEPYVYETVVADVECGNHDSSSCPANEVNSSPGNSCFTFTAKGRTDISLGWKQTESQIKTAIGMKAVVDENSDNVVDKSLAISEGQNFPNVECGIAEKWTSPPRSYTEDTLLSAMESTTRAEVSAASPSSSPLDDVTAGNKDSDTPHEVKKSLGTAATRANIIETLLKRGYVERRKKNIVATEKGISLIKVVPESIKSAKLTAEWETELQKIESGSAEADVFMESIAAFTRTLVASPVADNVEFGSARECVGKCPKCGSEIFENRKAYSCSKHCDFVIWKNIAKANITVAQAKKLLEKGKTDKIKGFKSKAGDDFEAILSVKSDFSVGFEF